MFTLLLAKQKNVLIPATLESEMNVSTLVLTSPLFKELILNMASSITFMLVPLVPLRYVHVMSGRGVAWAEQLMDTRSPTITVTL